MSPPSWHPTDRIALVEDAHPTDGSLVRHGMRGTARLQQMWRHAQTSAEEWRDVEVTQRHEMVQARRTDGFDTQGLPIALNARIAFSLCMSEEALVPIMVRLRDAGLVIERRERRYRIAALLSRLAELAAEGRGMDAGEVRFQAEMLPLLDQGT